MENLLLTGGGTLITLLLGGNIYFVKRLVDKIEATATASANASANFTTMNSNVTALASQLREIKTEIKELRSLEIDVAVIKTQLGFSRFSTHEKDQGG